MAWDDCYTTSDYDRYSGYDYHPDCDFPDEPEFDPDDPIDRRNHPPCDYCDMGCEEAPCTCFDWLD